MSISSLPKTATFPSQSTSDDPVGIWPKPDMRHNHSGFVEWYQSDRRQGYDVNVRDHLTTAPLDELAQKPATEKTLEEAFLDGDVESLIQLRRQVGRKALMHNHIAYDHQRTIDSLENPAPERLKDLQLRQEMHSSLYYQYEDEEEAYGLIARIFEKAGLGPPPIERDKEIHNGRAVVRIPFGADLHGVSQCQALDEICENLEPGLLTIITSERSLAQWLEDLQGSNPQGLRYFESLPRPVQWMALPLAAGEIRARRAAAVLALLPDQVDEDLFTLLFHDKPSVRSYAAQILGLGDNLVGQRLVRLLDYPSMRSLAAEAIAARFFSQRGTPAEAEKAVPFLLSHVHSTESELRLNAMRGLYHMRRDLESYMINKPEGDQWNDGTYVRIWRRQNEELENILPQETFVELLDHQDRRIVDLAALYIGQQDESLMEIALAKLAKARPSAQLGILQAFEQFCPGNFSFPYGCFSGKPDYTRWKLDLVEIAIPPLMELENSADAQLAERARGLLELLGLAMLPVHFMLEMAASENLSHRHWATENLGIRGLDILNECQGRGSLAYDGKYADEQGLGSVMIGLQRLKRDQDADIQSMAHENYQKILQGLEKPED